MLENKKEHKGLKQVDIVIIEDDKMLAGALVMFFKDKLLNADVYYGPKSFLENADKYIRTTKIFIDYTFKGEQMNGIELSHILHAEGFKHLYLLSGYDFAERKIPEYLTPILKTDIQALHKIVEK